MGSGLFLSELLSEDESKKRVSLSSGRGNEGEGYGRARSSSGSWEGASSIWNCPVNMNLAGVKSAAVADSRYSGMDVL